MILLVEDDLQVSKNIKEYLELKGENVVTALNALSCKQILNNQIAEFQLILLDIMLPDGDGIELLKYIRAVSDVPILFTTAMSAEEKAIEALNLGADDYLVKPFQPDLLLARINSVKRRVYPEKPINQEIIIQADKVLKINELSREVYLNDSLIDISTAEFEILLLLLKNRGRAISRNHIFQATKGKNRHSADRTIDIQISKLRAKLNLEQEIKTIWGKGYMFTYDNI